MKVRSNIRPNSTSIEIQEGVAIVRLVENVTETVIENVTIFEYDEYTVETSNREGLSEEVNADIMTWINSAKEKEAQELKNKYKHKTQEYIRMQYSEHDESKLTNAAVMDIMESRSPSAEYISYRHYIEECKLRALQEVYSV